ncbi:MAG: alpha/beta fold hydrolase [Gammaproteobacteria bacterium]
MSRRAGAVLATAWTLLAVHGLPAGAGDPPAPAAFDGSFRLENGEVITGGYFVEEGTGRYLYLEPEHAGRGGLFERIGETRLLSVFPDRSIEIEFFAGDQGGLDRLTWTEAGSEPLTAVRVHPHGSHPVEFLSGDGTRLRGRLLVPDCSGPHPVVISVHGSGPVNRYGGPYHTWFLTRGMAVLAYDKRGYTADPADWEEPDLARLSADAAAAVEFAADHPRLDPRRIGIVGSSQAGWVVPRAAVEAPRTAFIVLRAGAATKHLDTVLHEVRQELRLAGLGGLELDYAVQLRREIYQLALAGAPLSATDALVTPYLEEPWYGVAFGEGPVSGRWSPRWWGWARRNLAVSSVPWLKQFPGPVLWFLAERDENVPLVATRAALEEAFVDSPGNDQKIVVVDDAAHSFLVHPAEGPARFSPGFFAPMGRWLEDHGFSGDGCGAE